MKSAQPVRLWGAADEFDAITSHGLVPGPAMLAPILNPAEVITGDDGDNKLVGTDADDTISGGRGNDTVSGGGGDDTLLGDAAKLEVNSFGVNDSLSGGDGDDRMYGGFGFNTLDGGAGDDIAQLKADPNAAGPTTLNLDLSGYHPGTLVAVDNLVGGTDYLTSVERFQLTGTGWADTLVGASGNDTINGNGGQDVLSGGDGNDVVSETRGSATLNGGAGDDRLVISQTFPGDHVVADGGEGLDLFQTLYFGQNSSSGLIGGFHHGVYQLADEDGQFSARIINVERVSIRTQQSAATLTGGSGDDLLSGNGKLAGEAGDDVLAGSGALSGGNGSDTITGGSGSDLLSGGKGYDLYSFTMSTAPNAKSVDLSGFDTSGGSHVVNYGAGADTISGFEAVDVRDSGDNQTVIGSHGNDIIVNGFSAAHLDGGAGNDTIVESYLSAQYGGEAAYGGDTLDGGAGMDTLSFDGLQGASFDVPGPYLIDLAAGTVSGPVGPADAIAGFEAVIGSTADDTIRGSNIAERLEGAYGADSVSGGGGRDVLLGENGADTLSGGAAADLLDGGQGADVLTGGAGADRFQFSLATDSAPGAADRITDLTNSDIIDLSHIDADTSTAGDQAFHKVAAFTGAAGELTAVYDAGAGLTTISGDVDGDKQADLVIQVNGDHHLYHGFVL